MRKTGGTLYLNIIWHQHQPLYLDPELDQLQGPWVRTHGTKDYYDMAAMLEAYPNVHCTFNLTSSLLVQLGKYYVERIGPFVDRKRNRVDAEKFLSKWRGKTDPWIDLALTPTDRLNDRDLHFLLRNAWNALYISDVMVSRFPEYRVLKEKAGRAEPLSEPELRDIKFWFFLAYFDPDFLEHRVKLADGASIDLTDLVYRHYDGTYRLKKVITEDDCNRIVAETYKVLSNIIPIHKKLMYNPKSRTGQIDVATTPFYHPILPLVYDSDLAKICQPDHPLPPRFAYPADAGAQVAKAAAYFKKEFGRRPTGMWPAEGSVAQEIMPVFSDSGMEWIATDEKILFRSEPSNLPQHYPYRVDGRNPVAVVFRDTALSDKIGFTYQSWRGVDAANDFVNHVLALAPPPGEPERLVTVILDGENAWEWYRYDNDGKEFLHSLYGRLNDLYRTGEIVSVTMSEYIHGNPKRKISPHPVSSMKKIDRLYPGSWINSNFDTWIGIPEKNQAWEYLGIVRHDLERSGISAPRANGSVPKAGTKKWFAYQAWEEMYAAEGSDWFWWYGTRQYVPGGTGPFDAAFMGHLNNVYKFARLAGAGMPQREFRAISDSRSIEGVSQGAMKQSSAGVGEEA